MYTRAENSRNSEKIPTASFGLFAKTNPTSALRKLGSKCCPECKLGWKSGSRFLDPIQENCGHIKCRKCFTGQLKNSPNSANCKQCYQFNILPKCPECGLTWNEQKDCLPIQEKCGHFKCRPCYLRNFNLLFQPCIQCSRGGERAKSTANILIRRRTYNIRCKLMVYIEGKSYQQFFTTKVQNPTEGKENNDGNISTTASLQTQSPGPIRKRGRPRKFSPKNDKNLAHEKSFKTIAPLRTGIIGSNRKRGRPRKCLQKNEGRFSHKHIPLQTPLKAGNINPIRKRGRPRKCPPKDVENVVENNEGNDVLPKLEISILCKPEKLGNNSVGEDTQMPELYPEIPLVRVELSPRDGISTVDSGILEDFNGLKEFNLNLKDCLSNQSRPKGIIREEIPEPRENTETRAIKNDGIIDISKTFSGKIDSVCRKPGLENRKVLRPFNLLGLTFFDASREDLEEMPLLLPELPGPEDDNPWKHFAPMPCIEAMALITSSQPPADFNSVKSNCPECCLPWDPTERRPIEIKCGHIKCKTCYFNCLATDFESCVQCTLTASDD